jgi:diguanylate cyclase (GGDEF)-like protein
MDRFPPTPLPADASGSPRLRAAWRRWRTHTGAPINDRATLAAALVALNVVGGTMSVLWLVLPHVAAARSMWIVLATAATLLTAGILSITRGRSPWWLLQICVAADTLAVSVALVASGDPGSAYAFFYLWATLYAVCFFSLRQILVQAVLVGGAYAGSLALIGGLPAGDLVARWMLPMATLLATATLVRQLTGRLRHSEARLRRDAEHDPLTGLPNRASFATGLTAALKDLGGGPVSVLFIDLDHFKRVNDSLGHPAGDALLAVVAQRMRDAMSARDLVARFGGDEFLVLTREPIPDRAAERVRASLAAPFLVGKHHLNVTASIGLCTALKGDDVSTLMRDADAAVYRAKQRGRDRCERFEDDLRRELTDRVRIENDLRVALDEGALAVVYQPIVSLKTGAIVGAEALARWTHPVLGPISPADFIPVAEETGLIARLGEQILETACRDAASWLPGREDFHLAVNLSPRQLDSPHLMQAITSTLRATSVPGDRLLLEVTETCLLSDEGRTVENLRSIAAAGIGVALDDFGTGYSSLSHLKRLQVDVLKLDRSLLADVGEATTDAILDAVIGIGRATGMKVLAEGIETAEQHALLRDLGCGLGQGWHLGHPMPATEFTALLDAHDADVVLPRAA